MTAEQEVLQHVCQMEAPNINFNGQYFGVRELELVLTVLRVRGSVQISSVGEVASLLELGAQLRNL